MLPFIFLLFHKIMLCFIIILFIIFLFLEILICDNPILTAYILQIFSK